MIINPLSPPLSPPTLAPPHLPHPHHRVDVASDLTHLTGRGSGMVRSSSHNFTVHTTSDEVPEQRIPRASLEGRRNSGDGGAPGTTQQDTPPAASQPADTRPANTVNTTTTTPTTSTMSPAVDDDADVTPFETHDIKALGLGAPNTKITDKTTSINTKTSTFSSKRTLSSLPSNINGVEAAKRVFEAEKKELAKPVDTKALAAKDDTGKGVFWGEGVLLADVLIVGVCMNVCWCVNVGVHSPLLLAITP